MEEEEEKEEEKREGEEKEKDEKEEKEEEEGKSSEVATFFPKQLLTLRTKLSYLPWPTLGTSIFLLLSAEHTVNLGVI